MEKQETMALSRASGPQESAADRTRLRGLFAAVRTRVKAQSDLCASLRSCLRGQEEAAQKILTDARNACAGRLVLSGTGNEPFFVGHPPRWHEDPVNDGEFVADLNRMQHWNDCIAAFALTGEARFAQLVREELADWIKNCPCPPTEGPWEAIRPLFRGPKPWSSLEGGLRMMNAWHHAFVFLIQNDRIDEALFEQLAGSICDHARMLQSIPPKLWPDADHNHYLSENVGLFYASEMLQELPEAADWRAHAERELERCVQNQLTEDGGQIEGCPLYHNVCMDMLCKWAVSARRCGAAIPAHCLERIRRAIDYSLYALRPTGDGVPWGDSDPDDQIVQTAVLGWLVFGDRQWADAVRRFLPRERIRKSCARYCFSVIGADLDALFPEAPPAGGITLPRLGRQRQLQQVMLRTGWEPDALSVFFACRVPCQNGHGHIDPAGFDFCALGKALLVDPGRYTYREEALRRTLKSAEMHNTLTVGGKEPFTYVDTFLFSGERDGCILSCADTGDCLTAHAMHTSYFPAIHERRIALLAGRFLIVWDRLTHMAGRAPVQIWYNADTQTAFLGPDGTVTTADAVNFRLRASAPLQARLLPGLISEHIDVVRPSTRICLCDDGADADTRNYLSVICPFGAAAPDISPVRFDARGELAEFSVDGVRWRCEWRDDSFCAQPLPE